MSRLKTSEKFEEEIPFGAVTSCQYLHEIIFQFDTNHADDVKLSE